MSALFLVVILVLEGKIITPCTIYHYSILSLEYFIIREYYHQSILSSEYIIISIYYLKVIVYFSFFKMSHSNDNSTQKTRNYTLCRVCNLKGKKGNPLVTCILCSRQMHSKNSCATITDTITMQYTCITCKSMNRRSIQSANLTKERYSHSRAATPASTLKINRCNNGSVTTSTTAHATVQTACHDSTVQPACDILTHSNFEKDIQELNRLERSTNHVCQ